MRKRRKFAPEFKAKVALEALAGELTLAERLWRTLKYECIYLHAFETGSETRRGINRWVDKYNHDRPHSSLGDRTPDEAYRQIDLSTGPGLRPGLRKNQTAA